MCSRFVTIFLLAILAWTTSPAQSKYWIYFRDKGTWRADARYVSPKTLENRRLLGMSLLQESDVPVYAPYIDSLQQWNATVVCRSRWLNAVSVVLNPADVQAIAGLSFVRACRPMAVDLYAASEDDYGPAYKINNYALEQTHAAALAERKLTGRGVDIGIIDGNFYKADSNRAVAHVFAENRMIQTRNFVRDGQDQFFNIGNNPQDIHASVVWQLIAGYDAETRTPYGVATGANFYLARTDERDREYQGEEDYWIAALEWLDSLGVRLVHSSLAYSKDFDDPSENHTPDEMNGNTTAISKAARIGAEEKGMIIVVAAGNAGKITSWRIVKAPADVASVISVGATLLNGSRAKSSSIGAEHVGFVKPDLVCFSQGGTSLSAPIITGIAACLLEQNKALSPRDMKRILAAMGNLQHTPNNYIGYGVPDVRKALAASQSSAAEAASLHTVRARKRYVLRCVTPCVTQEAIVYHKKGTSTVVAEDLVTLSRDRFTIQRPEQARQTTVIVGDTVKEIIWKN